MSIGHPILELRLFQSLTLKIKGEGHGWGGHWKSQCWSSILSTHIAFVPCQSALPFLRYSIFKVWPWKSRVKVMGEVTVQSHNVGLTSYRLTSLSFHVNRPSYSWDTAFSKFDIENQGSSQMTLMLHNCGSRQFHRTLNGINPSSGFKDMGSPKSGPSAAWFDKFLAHGQAHIGQMGKWPWQCTTWGLDNSTKLRMEKIRQAVTEIWVPQVWQPPARPPGPWRQYPSSPEGWGVKMDTFRRDS